MAAIRSLDVENFRCFKVLRVRELAPINLFVGANNAGKTAILEAIEAILSIDGPYGLYRASVERGEFRRKEVADEVRAQIDLRHWFYGHGMQSGTSLTIRASGDRERSVTRRVERVPATAPSPPFVPGGLQLVTEVVGGSSIQPLPLTEDHLLGAGPISGFRNFGFRLRPPVGFITTDRVYPTALARLWTNVVLTPGEESTIRALKIVDPRIERIALSESEGTIAKVLLKGAVDPVPLGTLGEGVTRMLTLAMHLALTTGGFLLIDEIENGLHWSVMHKVWRLLVETARANHVQVFATTHSKDLVEALAALHRSEPELAADVVVHRLEAGSEESVRMDAAGVAQHVDLELEAR